MVPVPNVVPHIQMESIPSKEMVRDESYLQVGPLLSPQHEYCLASQPQVMSQVLQMSTAKTDMY
jgi:hypothetical protein